MELGLNDDDDVTLLVLLIIIQLLFLFNNQSYLLVESVERIIPTYFGTSVGTGSLSSQSLIRKGMALF